MLTMSIATTAILTKGLCGAAEFDLTALEYGSTITTPFDLLPRIRTNLPPVGGGPYPYPAHNRLEPGQIQKFYQPIDSIDELKEVFSPYQGTNTGGGAPAFGGEPYVVPLDMEAQYFGLGNRAVTVNVNFKGKQSTKHYSVSKDLNDNAVQIDQIINQDIKQYQPVIKQIKKGKYKDEQ